MRRLMILPRVAPVADRFCQRKEEIDAAPSIDAVAAIFNDIEKAQTDGAPSKPWGCTFECAADRRALWRPKSELYVRAAGHPLQCGDDAVATAPTVPADLQQLDEAVRLKSLSPALNEPARVPATLAPRAEKQSELDSLRQELGAFRQSVTSGLAQARATRPEQAAALEPIARELEDLAAELDRASTADGKRLSDRLRDIKNRAIPILYCLESGAKGCSTTRLGTVSQAIPPRPGNSAEPTRPPSAVDLAQAAENRRCDGFKIVKNFVFYDDCRRADSLASARDLNLLLPSFAPELLEANGILISQLPGAKGEALDRLVAQVNEVKRRLKIKMFAYFADKQAALANYRPLGVLIRSYPGVVPAELLARYEALMKLLPADEAIDFNAEPDWYDWQDRRFEALLDRLKHRDEHPDEADDAASLRIIAQQLAELSQAALAKIEALVAGVNDPKKRLEILQARAFISGHSQDAGGPKAFEGLNWTPEGTLELTRSTNWFTAESWTLSSAWDRRIERLQLEARLVLGTRFPIVYVPSTADRALVLAGEDHDVRKEWEAAKKRLAELEAQFTTASGAVSQAQTNLADARTTVLLAEQTQVQRDQQLTAARGAATALEGEFQQAVERERAAKSAFEATKGEYDDAVSQASLAEFWRQLVANKTADRDILFEEGSSELQPAGREQLQKIADVLAARSKELQKRTGQRLALMIIGHTNHTGGEAFNIRLSKLRAAVVKAFLLRQKTMTDAPLDLSTDGVWWKEPVPGIADPKDPRHRRVEFRIVGAEQEQDLSAQEAARAADRVREIAERRRALSQDWETAAQALAGFPPRLEAARRDIGSSAEALHNAQGTLKTARLAQAEAERNLNATQAAARDAQSKAEAQRKIAQSEERRATGALLIESAGDDGAAGDRAKLRERIVATLTDAVESPYGFSRWAGFTTVRKFFNMTGLADKIAEYEERFRKESPGLFGYSGPYTTRMAIALVRGGERSFVFGQPPPDKPKPSPPPVKIELPQERAIPIEIVTAPALGPAPATVVPDSGQPGQNGEPLAAASPAPVASDRSDVPVPDYEATARQAAEQARLAASNANDALGAAQRAQTDAQRALAAARDARRRAEEARRQLERAVGGCGAGSDCSIGREAFFERGSHQLTADGQATLANVCTSILSRSDLFSGRTVFIHGYASAEGSARFNQRLSEERAQSVLAYFRAHCASAPVTFVPIGSGVSTERESAEANRYVHFEVK